MPNAAMRAVEQVTSKGDICIYYFNVDIQKNKE